MTPAPASAQQTRATAVKGDQIAHATDPTALPFWGSEDHFRSVQGRGFASHILERLTERRREAAIALVQRSFSPDRGAKWSG